jgi:hypothetical protein
MNEENVTFVLALDNIETFGLREGNFYAFKLGLKSEFPIFRIMHKSYIETEQKHLLNKHPFGLVYDISKLNGVNNLIK